MIFIDGSKGEGTFSSGTARAQADFVTEPSGLPSTPRIWLQRAPRKRCTPTPVHGRRKGDKRDTRVRPRPQQPCRQPGGVTAYHLGARGEPGCSLLPHGPSLFYSSALRSKMGRTLPGPRHVFRLCGMLGKACPTGVPASLVSNCWGLGCAEGSAEKNIKS